MEKPVDKSLLIKFINNNCSVEEISLVSTFLQQPGADQLFEEILNERWKENSDDDLLDEVQMQDWENKFNERLIKHQSTGKSRFKLTPYYRYAAIWAVLILGAGVFGFYQFLQKSTSGAIAMLETTTAPGKLVKVQLPDGTIVYLNAASRLRYPERFDGKTREVSLEGEAFFDVKHDQQHPFLVHADQLNIHVLGTSFNIRSYQNDEDIAVTVSTGKVGVTVPLIKEQKTSFLFPNKELNYHKKSAKLEIKTVNAQDSRAWETASFIFNYETLEQITKRLSRWYNVSFVCRNQQVLQQRFKLKLKNENLKNVMDALSSSGKGFSYQIKDKQVIIK